MELDISFGDTTVRTQNGLAYTPPSLRGSVLPVGDHHVSPRCTASWEEEFAGPCRRTASRPPDQLKQPRMAQQEEQSAQHGEAEPTEPRGEQPAQEPPTQPAQPEKGHHQDMRAIQMGGARTLYCHNTQPAECGQGREVCVEQTTDQEGDQPPYRAIMATDQTMSSGEGLTAHYPQTQRELQPVLGGFTAKGSQDGIGVSSCGTPGRPQDDTSPREADAKPRKTDRQTIPPPNQLREQPELYCLRTCDGRDREDDNHWPQSFHPDPKLGSRGPDKTSSITVEKGLPFGKCGASQADPRTDNRITLASRETTTANSQQITLVSQGGAGVERVPTERSTGTTTQSAPLPAVNTMDQPVGKQMLSNPSGGQTAFPGDRGKVSRHMSYVGFPTWWNLRRIWGSCCEIWRWGTERTTYCSISHRGRGRSQATLTHSARPGARRSGGDTLRTYYYY